MIRIKNMARVPRSIRPYKDRGVLVSFKVGETHEIDISQCEWDVQRNPKAYFGTLGFDTLWGSAGEKPSIEKKVETPTPQKPQEAIKPAIQEQLSESVKFSVDSGDFKHYNAASSSWQGLRRVKDWVLDRVIYDSSKNKYFKVTSLDGDQMVCKALTESEAISITGRKAD